ncbi:MAG: hypothetical protein H6581_25105 [Bacteroidia bacterium]|nr:hypothetical protein [Bacteroidia bacterium]
MKPDFREYIRQRKEEEKNNPLKPLKEFFISIFNDADWQEASADLKGIKKNSGSQAILKFKNLLDRVMEDPQITDRQIQDLVLGDANESLDDQSPEGCREWLRKVTDLLDQILAEP